MSEQEIMQPVKARIVDDLLAAIEIEMPKEGHREDQEFLALCERIQGKIVTLRFIGPDAFESVDDNYWLPNSCWELV
jgi:hypothetical protein